MRKRWFVEGDPFSPINYRYAVNKVIHKRRSAVQEIKVLEHGFFGRMLVLDDIVQLTERDEFFYHEMLAHVPMHLHPSPQRVLVVGGGDGGTLRESLKHSTVRAVELVDIDPEVTAVSERYFPDLSAGFQSPIVTRHTADGAAFLREPQEKYDIILVDAPDPLGPAKSLSTPEFFGKVESALSDGGVFAMQTESMHFHIDFVAKVQEMLRGIFPWVGLYAAPLATYAGNWWSFSIASKVSLPTGPVRGIVPGTTYYCDEVHEKSFINHEVLDKLVARHRTFVSEHS